LANSRALFSHNAHGLIMGLQKKVKSHIINNLLTSIVPSLWESLESWSCRIYPAIAQAILYENFSF